ncbi:uncharacterized protein HaLaN_19466, partial [Haematococcus lacustris]
MDEDVEPQVLEDLQAELAAELADWGDAGSPTTVSPEHAAQLESILQQEAGHTHRLLYCLRDKNLWTKLRPFVHQFLEACQPLFEMHIYTMGDRAYAAA